MKEHSYVESRESSSSLKSRNNINARQLSEYSNRTSEFGLVKKSVVDSKHSSKDENDIMDKLDLCVVKINKSPKFTHQSKSFKSDNTQNQNLLDLNSKSRSHIPNSITNIAQPSTNSNCIICDKSIDVDDLSEDLVFKSNCGHIAHKNCIRDSIHNQICKNYRYKFKCPISSCRKDIQKSLLKRVLNEEDIIKIDSLEFVFRACFNSNKTVYWCVKEKNIYIHKSSDPKCDTCEEKGLSIKTAIKLIKDGTKESSEKNRHKNEESSNLKKIKQVFDEIEVTLQKCFTKCKKCSCYCGVIYCLDRKNMKLC